MALEQLTGPLYKNNFIFFGKLLIIALYFTGFLRNMGNIDLPLIDIIGSFPDTYMDYYLWQILFFSSSLLVFLNIRPSLFLFINGLLIIFGLMMNPMNFSHNMFFSSCLFIVFSISNQSVNYMPIQLAIVYFGATIDKFLFEPWRSGDFIKAYYENYDNYLFNLLSNYVDSQLLITTFTYSTEYAALLRKEWELTVGKKVSKAEWIDENIKFLTRHSFYTPEASKKWESRKGKNLAGLIQEQNSIKEKTDKQKLKKAELNFKKSKQDLPDRGIETMFRVALRNHITLSDIADTKANILLSVNAIIISVALSNLLPKLDNPSNSYLIYPTMIFLAFTVVSIVLSVLATRPNVTRGKFSKEDVANQKVNLLFFGNFHQMSLNDFEWAMGEMMKDKDYLYGSLTKDLYFLGLVLNRKYSLLRKTYTVFMIGIIVSVIAFAIAFKFYSRETFI